MHIIRGKNFCGYDAKVAAIGCGLKESADIRMSSKCVRLQKIVLPHREKKNRHISITRAYFLFIAQ